MNHSSIPIDKSGRVIKCPICGEDNVLADSKLCHVCNSPSANYCYGHEEEIAFNEWEYIPSPCPEGTARPLPGNARYCPYCGNITTFYHAGYLKAWNYEEQDAETVSDDDLFVEELEDFRPLDDAVLPPLDNALPF